jgi:hypothetical protein
MGRSWICPLKLDLSFFNSFSHSSMALQPFVRPWPRLQFRNFFTQTVEFLGRVISLSKGRYLHTGPHKHRHPCLKWDSNSWTQRSSEQRQFMLQIAGNSARYRSTYSRDIKTLLKRFLYAYGSGILSYLLEPGDLPFITKAYCSFRPITWL